MLGRGFPAPGFITWYSRYKLSEHAWCPWNIMMLPTSNLAWRRHLRLIATPSGVLRPDRTDTLIQCWWSSAENRFVDKSGTGLTLHGKGRTSFINFRHRCSLTSKTWMERASAVAEKCCIAWCCRNRFGRRGLTKILTQETGYVQYLEVCRIRGGVLSKGPFCP